MKNCNSKFEILHLTLLFFIFIFAFSIVPYFAFASAPTMGLVGYWAFDEQSGTTATDSSGSGNTGTLTNGPVWTPGKLGQALKFDGVDDVITTTSDFIGTSAASISAWIYPRSAGEGNCGTVVHNFSTELQINCGVGNVLLFTSNNYTNIASSAAIFPSRFNTWIHVVVTRTSSGTANIYVDGVLSGTANQNSGTPAGGSTNVNIGNRTASLDQTFDGIIDEVRIYNRVLSAQEVSDIYNDTGGPTPTPTVTPTPTPPSDTTPPSTPANLSATVISSSQINLSWNASTDNVGVTGYDIYRGGVFLTSVTGTSYSNTGLTASTQYSYTVRANDAAGNASSQSSPVSATTQASTPPSGNRVDLLNSSGGFVNTYTTIQSCINAMSAGQTCNVYAGTYNENVNVSAGTVGNYKTVTVNGSDIVYAQSFIMNSYTKVNGFRIQNPSSPNSRACVSMGAGVNHVYITNNILYACGSDSMITTSNTAGASHVYIQGNTLSYPCTVSGTPGVCYGMSLVGDHFLVENNDLSHFWLGIYHAASYSVFRNNIFHDVNQSDCSNPSCHTDFIFSEPVAPSFSQYTIIENNVGRNSVGSDAKGFLLQADACNGNCYNSIVRFNTVAHTGSSGLLDDNAFNSSVPGFSRVKTYNNTWVDTNNIVHEYSFTSVFSNNSTHGSTINDLFYYPRSLVSFNPYATDSGTSGTFSSNNNLAYCIGSPCNLKGRVYDRGVFTEDPGNQIANPQFINYASNDFRLQSSSPAINAGGQLTTVASTDSGDGTTLRLNDVAYFQDGYGIAGAQADCIAIGSTTNTACISSVNYSTNTLTLSSSISRSPGQNVYLFRDSDGTQVLYGSAPDIGAYEYTGGGTPPPTPIPGDLNLDHIVNSLDFSLLNSKWFQNYPAYDLNSDSQINSLDYAILSSNWLKTW